ncbi:4-alpha-glucanotransferase, partial [Spirillospora sp. NPDC049652]
MNDRDLRALARVHGVSTAYVDWRGRHADVSVETLRAVLTSLGEDVSTPAAVRDGLARAADPPRLPPVVVTRPGRSPAKEGTVELADGRVLDLPVDGDLPLGWHRLTADGEEAALLVAPERLGTGPRAWGVTAQLYSVRSRASWGMGDLRDLAGLAGWGARQGADFLLVNPLHATEPVPPVGPSPYSPMSRRFASPLYLRVEDVPEYATLPPDERERVDGLSAPLRALNETLDVLDRDAVHTAKMRALEILYAAFRGDEAYAEFRRREGAPLTAFATWCALCEEQGPDWRAWPPGLR